MFGYEANKSSQSKNLGVNDIGNSTLDNNLNRPNNSSVNVNQKQSPEIDPNTLLYDKTIDCPVCEARFKARTVKKEGSRIKKQESDFFVEYYPINKYFYEVVVCPSCGYSALNVDFNSVREYQFQKIFDNITHKWKEKHFPPIYDVDIAIERYKLALVTSMVCEGKSSQKAMLCLRLAWMYRIKNDGAKEKAFLSKALDGFLNCYYEESVYPIYSMDRYSLCYLIGELYRRLDKPEEALRWLGEVIVSTQTKYTLKEKARAQRDLIKTK
ncbi:DUF2225 domain-containing protein [Clostridium cellulovorans]|uniref:DUF2225 domain-containing protein n=1 Tax=Clostridium cellulovorans (strain ATCC 35296 / DSM 3052 / OCM 3 / 743B) TaxID=573061 RepID=D9SRT3_CLOC7|nr:DUF2225 domain-containing protein [Clostridium cellulovorans]ADL50450.1 Protein of unknown function DUF2225 [Clostridium cellulovorans 743B]